MNRCLKLNGDVFVTVEKCPTVDRKDIGALIEAAPRGSQRRVRLCTHRAEQDRQQEMFIAFAGGGLAYLRPSLHLGKDESLHVLEGEADFILFDNVGHVTQVIPLGDYHSGRQFYCRVPASTWHTVLIRSERMAVHEVTSGPYVRSDTIWAPWAPDEKDLPAAQRFMDWLRKEAAQHATGG
jgi:cupin fold WbuC family metalloprotein